MRGEPLAETTRLIVSLSMPRRRKPSVLRSKAQAIKIIIATDSAE
jgi:hypothetical protein